MPNQCTKGTRGKRPASAVRHARVVARANKIRSPCRKPRIRQIHGNHVRLLQPGDVLAVVARTSSGRCRGTSRISRRIAAPASYTTSARRTRARRCGGPPSPERAVRFIAAWTPAIETSNAATRQARHGFAPSRSPDPCGNSLTELALVPHPCDANTRLSATQGSRRSRVAAAGYGRTKPERTEGSGEPHPAPGRDTDHHGLPWTWSWAVAIRVHAVALGAISVAILAHHLTHAPRPLASSTSGHTPRNDSPTGWKGLGIVVTQSLTIWVAAWGRCRDRRTCRRSRWQS